MRISFRTAFVVVFCLSLLAPGWCFASGFALPEQSSSAMGMASAFVAQADDVTAVWYNPAALTDLEGTWVAAGITPIYPSFKHETTFGFTESIEHKVHTPIHLYGSTKTSDRMAIGIGINNPFGLSTTWSPTSTTAAIATLSSVKTFNVNPSLAYRLSDSLSIAVGINYLFLDATLASTRLSLSGDGDGWGGNASVFFKATEKINLGFTYHRQIKVDIDGVAAGVLPAATSITLPDEFKIGASYKASDNLTVNAEADMTNWSTYDKIEIPALGLIDPKNWQDTWCFRVGGQYKVSESWKLRAGYLYDTNPVREEYLETRVPDSDRQGISLGFGHTGDSFTVDAAYLYLHFNQRTINDSLADLNFQVLNGNYSATAHIASVTISRKF